MKRLSIRFKLTFWFTAALVLVALLSCSIVLSVSSQILQKGIRDSLIETVERNRKEIEFYPDLSQFDLSSSVDHFVDYEGGYLRVDNDFLDAVNQVYTALYRSDITLLYGENPISRELADLKFVDAQLREVNAGGTVYYIFDRKLTSEGLDGLWLRGVVSEARGTLQMSSITRLSLILLPVMVLLASVGGYLLAGRMLRPIKKISETARQIGRENDLKKRIELGKGTDELHQLADSFNDMFGKLDSAFETQRQFTSDASHELRTPMAVILAQCELTLEQERSTAEYEEALRLIRRQSRRMSKMINDMLDFTRLEAGGTRYVKEAVDLTELVSSVCEDMALIREQDITLQYEAEAGVTCTGSRELLSRLLSNLIGNAYRYGKENGHIWVRLWREGEEIRLSVADDGIGIPMEEQDRIFRRFYQADRSRSGTGAGLGLSMAYEIAKFHGGALRVESEPDRGSTFTFSMPG